MRRSVFERALLAGVRVSNPAESVVMARYNPFQFMQEGRQEVAKVTWPTRKEVWTTTLAVLIMVGLASLFFLIADQTIGWLVSLVLGFGQ